MSKIMKQNPVAAPKIQQTLDDILQASIRRWKTNGDNAEGVVLNCAMALKIANEQFYKPKNIPLPFDPNILLEVINKDKGFNRTLNTDKKHRETGIMVEFLTLFGCSINQAVRAIAEWNGESESTIKIARIQVQQEEINGDTIGFFFRNFAIARSFIMHTKERAFPIIGSYPLAQTAYKKLCQACGDAKVEQAYKLAIAQSEYNYKEIYELLISIYPDIREHGKFDYSRV